MSTRVTTQSYGSKIGASFKGVIFGFFAIIGSIVLLWFNEGNSVKEIRKIAEGKKNTVSVDASVYSPENEGLLVHMTGMAETDDLLSDNEFGFEVNALKFKKVVEMYQYKENKKTETKDNVGGSTTTTETFTYEEVWSESLINSDGFYESWRKNPKDFEHRAASYQAKSVRLGEYELSEGLISQIGGFENYYVTEEIYPAESNNGILSSGVIYFGSGSKNPQIGDERVSFKVSYPHNISIVSQQQGNSFVPYVTENGRTIELVYDGIKTAEEIFTSEASKNSWLTWILRLVGFVLMYVGFAAILKPISTVGSVLPLLGNVLQAGTNLIAGLIAFVLSFTVIALAWIFYRPILGISLLLVAGATFYFGRKHFAKDEEVKPAPAVEDGEEA
jgi:hypothetical protein